MIVTDDNPRSEDPAAIRAAILAAAPGAREIGDRAEAIRDRRGRIWQPGDVLVIAGKGHETGQIIGRSRAAIQRPRGGRAPALSRRRRMSGPEPLMDLRTLRWRKPCAAQTQRRAAGRHRPASRSIAARIAPGDAFFAIKGDVRDGHDFVVEAALKAGAAVAVIAAASAASLPTDAPLLVVPDVLDGLRALAAPRRATTRRQDHRGDRLGRQDQHQGGAAARARARR